ncbi:MULTISPECIES: helix-turn-helix transcriptional regulator [unclassified Mesorhizobium]|uniref:helix-turn-helix domain-containing protein n=1 Tax=unclassified Mesorhizobium TaxID=325217 RepID=UPI0011261A3F|nr:MULTISPECIES: helix-turn-helix transcriptional regulator [unclassified Mesorhizobium]TPJ66647.1 helix-turn-helix transcriptional regulator [Mesorhizobium sp. B2-6-1]TPL49301.1 helix-turn-helix transcriptional regulator [Mesorhizobium sp. B2-4-2]TPN16908.1 helix-turn-helix transcriptional regulator [Mesorhizobium sp. B2-1-3]
MASEDLPENLRLLCSYSKSVSEVCRRLGINRHQFQKYLNGTAFPSLRTLRRIGDYFGVEESEILLDTKQFSELVAVKRPIIDSPWETRKRISNLLFLGPSNNERFRNITGFYHNHFCAAEYPGRILRGLVHIYNDNGVIFSKNIERKLPQRDRTIRKYDGLLVNSADRIIMYEREASVGKMAWITIYYQGDRDQPDILLGLSVGITGTFTRELACYRVLLQRLPSSLNLRTALRQCGVFDFGDPVIDEDIQARVRNKMDDEDWAFSIQP